MTNAGFRDFECANKDASQRLVLTPRHSLTHDHDSCLHRYFLGYPEIIARVRRHRWPDIRFGSRISSPTSSAVNARSHASIQPWEKGSLLMAVGGRFRGESVGGYLVKDIGWYATTPSQKIPTDYCAKWILLGANVINISRQTARIMVMNIRVRLDDLPTIPVMTSEIEEYLHDHPAVTNPPERQSACISVMSYLTKRVRLRRTHTSLRRSFSGEPRSDAWRVCYRRSLHRGRRGQSATTAPLGSGGGKQPRQQCVVRWHGSRYRVSTKHMCVS